MIAAVLWLGNISFHVIDNENHIEVVANEGTCISLVVFLLFSYGLVLYKPL